MRLPSCARRSPGPARPAAPRVSADAGRPRTRRPGRCERVRVSSLEGLKRQRIGEGAQERAEGVTIGRLQRLPEEPVPVRAAARLAAWAFLTTWMDDRTHGAEEPRLVRTAGDPAPELARHRARRHLA